MGTTSPMDALRRPDALHDHLPAGVVVHDADGGIVFANRLAQELLGRSEAELLGTDPGTAGWIVLRRWLDAAPGRISNGNRLAHGPETVRPHCRLTERMHELRAHGICFSLDDFGTGYSSLAYLKSFPLAALKIDRSFVRDVGTNPESAPIVEAIIALARKLKLDIVAEGVEDEAQRNFLIHGGCSSMQGFLLGRPLPIAEFEHLYSAAWIGHA
jgi:hypothetical protein